MNIVNKNKYSVFYLDPKKIKYCTKNSKFCDYTQYSLNRNHTHAGNDRGVFYENKDGLVRIINSDWDKPGIEFKRLLEFVALKNHYSGKQKWRNSRFASRLKKYIRSLIINKSFLKKLFKEFKDYFNNTSFLYKNIKVNKLIEVREKIIDNLFESISKNGIYPFTNKIGKKKFINNISINVGDDCKIYFNNRGHHRLAIAKIINLKSIPVKLTVVKSKGILKSFVLDN